MTPLRLALAAGLCAALAAAPAAAGCLEPRLTGVNLAGAEFNSKRLPGVMNKDYTYPSRDDIAYFATRGANAIRLPVRWERLQRTLGGELDSAETAAVAKVLATAAEWDLCVIIDLHNYGSWHGAIIGSPELPPAAFRDLWLRLAARFPDARRVAFGLMNEPFRLTIAQWAELARDTVADLRTAGAEQLLLVSGGRWSGVHEWQKTFSGTSNAAAFAGLRDPLQRMAIEVHQYADADYSGTGATCHPPERFDNMFRAIGDWARANGHKLFLGEFGVPADANCLAVLERKLQLTADRAVWLGWAYWAAGRWWGTYPLSVHPRGGEDAPQMRVLDWYLGR